MSSRRRSRRHRRFFHYFLTASDVRIHVSEMSIESAVIEKVDSLSRELVRFTRALITVSSENPPGEERDVSKVVHEKLTSIGARLWCRG